MTDLRGVMPWGFLRPRVASWFRDLAFGHGLTYYEVPLPGTATRGYHTRATVSNKRADGAGCYQAACYEGLLKTFPDGAGCSHWFHILLSPLRRERSYRP